MSFHCRGVDPALRVVVSRSFSLCFSSRILVVTIAFGLIAPISTASSASAADKLLAETKIVMKQATSGKQKLVLKSKDSSWLFPTQGSDDDPTSGTPGGLTIQMFSPATGWRNVTIPSTPAAPAEWQSKPGQYKYKNKSANADADGIRAVTLKEGKSIKIVSKSSVLPMDDRLRTVGIRITTGTERNCAVFGHAFSTSVKDEVGKFSARGSDTEIFQDCSDQTITTTIDCGVIPECVDNCPGGFECGALVFESACRCISSAQPCGDTVPVCNGTCPDGFTCGSTAPGFFTGCGCIPDGAVACGEATMTTCGGECPGTQECSPVHLTISVLPTVSGCACAEPGPCAEDNGCGSGYQCGPGEVCSQIAGSFGGFCGCQ